MLNIKNKVKAKETSRLLNSNMQWAEDPLLPLESILELQTEALNKFQADLQHQEVLRMLNMKEKLKILTLGQNMLSKSITMPKMIMEARKEKERGILPINLKIHPQEPEAVQAETIKLQLEDLPML